MKIETQVYRKSTNTGLLLHFQSHTDKRYKDCLLKTMIHNAYMYTLSSTPEAFNEECARLRSIFIRLDCSIAITNSTINNFIQNTSSRVKERQAEDSSVL